jgi:two-component system, LytTR family, response regulator LytT
MTRTPGPFMMDGMRVLAVDDERHALEGLADLLRAHPRVTEVQTARDGIGALRAVDQALAAHRPLDAVFLDVRMAGPEGMVVARVLSRLASPPGLVVMTGRDDAAAEASEVGALDYLLKPVRADRLAESLRRVAAVDPSAGASDAVSPAASTGGLGVEPRTRPGLPGRLEETVPVELGGITRFLRRSDIQYVEARGDYARLHTATGAHLVRVSLSTLEQCWREAGFVRIHRSHLVALAHVDELRSESGRVTVRIGHQLLPVSRRCSRELRDRLVRRTRPDRAATP